MLHPVARARWAHLSAGAMILRYTLYFGELIDWERLIDLFCKQQADSRPAVKRNPNASSFDAPSASSGFGDTGASCVKVHNAPGGNSSISFGGPEPTQAPVSRAKKGEFVDNRIGCGVENRAPASNPKSGAGFGDSGASSVKVHHAPGGKSSGNILNWQ